MEIPEEGQIGLGLRVPEARPKDWGVAKRGKGLAGTPEATASHLLAREQGAIGAIPQM